MGDSLTKENITEAIIPEGTTEIADRTFMNCKNLKHLSLPSTLTSIGASAFSSCENLEEIVLPHGIKTIQYRAFADCKRLKKIVIPDGIEQIDWAAFSGCENLEEIVLPNSIKQIGEQLFLNCKKLKRVVLPDSLTSLPNELFKGCNSLDIRLNSKITSLGNRTFEDCYKLSAFPEFVTSFGENCFRNCRNLTTVTLNPHTVSLSSGMFDGCVNLKDITYNGSNKLNIGTATFRNCKSLKEIPKFISHLNMQAFENCVALTDVEVSDSIIPTACFRGCINLKNIQFNNRILEIHNFAFSGCNSLESMDLSDQFISTIAPETFSNCKKLRRVKLPYNTRIISSRSFFNCPVLEEIVLPETVEIVKKEAFKGCSSIKTLYIPGNLKTFEHEAFAYMDSLENIEVSPFNKVFMTPDHKILIKEDQQKLVLYASGCKDKTYSLHDYCYYIDGMDRTIIRPITYIGEYAFAGAKNLESLTILGTQDIEISAFEGCESLKKLVLEGGDFFTCPSINIRENGRYYFEMNGPSKITFDELEFTGDIVSIFNSFNNFKNVKKITFNCDHPFSIGTNIFRDCTLLEKVYIPNIVTSIGDDSFSPNTLVEFENGLKLKKFKCLTTEIRPAGEYKLYEADDVFYIELNGKIIKLTKRQIRDCCTHPEILYKNVITFFEFVKDLTSHDLIVKELFSGIFIANLGEENKNILLSTLKKDDKFYIKVLKESGLLDISDEDTKELFKPNNFIKVVNYIELLRKYNITNPIFYNRFLINNFDISSLERLINSDLELLTKILIESRNSQMGYAFLNHESISKAEYESYKNSLNTNKNRDISLQTIENLEKFISLIKKYNIKDKFLYNKAFISLANNPLFEDLLKNYDANIKRLLKLSYAFINLETAHQNLSDLLIFMKITGALEDDPLTRQKVSTFISEKIFQKTLPNGEDNRYQIVGDDLHRIFNFPDIYEFDEEFALFFRENYQQLIEEERLRSGFIQRVYVNFKNISKTSTSDKGSQRKLKVSFEKCKNYLNSNKFDGVLEEEMELAKLISSWYDTNKSWEKAKSIYQESLTAPRNIFTEIVIDDEGNPIYDYNPNHDLKESLCENFSYEWLPKQDYDNLVLGKYCNCCAHVEGAGQGIMRASMILDCCQNLVIRNSIGTIIAKATVYVNKKEGYAVFNNVESSLNYRTESDLKNIYNAFIRGAKAFLKEYNKSNPEFPIFDITIGATRNTILDFLTNDKHPTTAIHKSLEFGKYSLQQWSQYDGDWKSSQRLVIKK